MTQYKDIKVGSLISAYHKGYHEVVSIKERTKQKDRTDSPIVYYRAKFDSGGKTISGKTLKCCDATYCEPAANTILRELKEMAHKENSLRALLKQL